MAYARNLEKMITILHITSTHTLAAVFLCLNLCTHALFPQHCTIAFEIDFEL